MFAGKVQETAAGDLAGMGLGVVSFTVHDIRPNQGYLNAPEERISKQVTPTY